MILKAYVLTTSQNNIYLDKGDGNLIQMGNFYDIEDALEILQEACAPYTSCTGTLYLMDGDHYLLR